MVAEGCTSCGAPCPADARFCPSCGAPLPLRCTACGEPLPDGARFCSSCGASTEQRASREPLAEVVSERRLASVLFADLVGFTTLSEARDPEQVRELLSRYFASCREVIARYDGVVEKFIGDAVMAVWGVPTAHEDDAERAVRAGADLASMVAALGAELGAPLALRVGIVTGEVAVTVGATAEGMVAGDPVNTASRVQSAAEPGQVWVDAATRGLTSHVVEYDDTGDHALKGKAEPVRLYAARRVHATRVDAEAVSTPLIGRERELGLLQELFEASVADARGRLVVVDGEAGVGKSRLVREFETWLDDRPGTTRWHRGRCLSYGDGVAFWALSEMARTRLGLLEGDSGSVVSDRLDDWLGRDVDGPEEASRLRERLLVLVGGGGESSFDRGDLFVSWTRFFELVGGGDPVVLVIDDAHHADDGLLDFVDHLVGTTRTPVFVIAMARSELLDRRPGWGGRRAAVLPLEPLAPEEMRALVDSLVDGVPPADREALVSRTGGLPLFAVETVRALLDQGLVTRTAERATVAAGARLELDAMTAPESLRGLVTARLDLLPADERRVVSDASVLGLSFTLDGLAALGHPGDELDAAVGSLLRREVFDVEDDRFSGERGQLRFVHAVVRQVAYAVLSRRDRKHRHLLAAGFLASQVDDSGDIDAVVAQHLVDALDASFDDDTDVPTLRSEAARRSRRAAERSRQLGAPGQAARLFERSSALTDDTKEAALLVILAADAATDAGEADRGADLAQRGTDALEDLGDLRAAAEGYATLARALSWSGQYPELKLLVEACLPRIEALPEAEEASYLLLERLSIAYSNLGPPEKSDECFRQLMDRGLASADPRMRATGYSAQAALCEAREDWVGAVAAYDRVIELAREQGDSARVAVSLINSGAAETELDVEAALARIRAAFEEARRAGMRNIQDFAACGIPEMLHYLGRIDEMVAAVEALDVEDLTTNAYYIGVWNEATCARTSGRDFPVRAADRNSEGNQPRFMQALALLESALADDRPEDAVVAAGRALDLCGEGLLVSSAWSVMPQFVDAAHVSGDRELRARLLELASSTDLTTCTPLRRAMTLLARSVLDLEADDRYTDALAALDACRLVGFAAKARAQIARGLEHMGRVEEARPLREAAVATYQRIGALGWLAELERSISG